MTSHVGPNSPLVSFHSLRNHRTLFGNLTLSMTSAGSQRPLMTLPGNLKLSMALAGFQRPLMTLAGFLVCVVVTAAHRQDCSR